MNLLFDVAVVGAGPTAFAALKALKGQGLKVCVITGSRPDQTISSHSKIISTEYEQNFPSAFADGINCTFTGIEIFSSAEVGGLCRYWGQQFQRYTRNDPWNSGGNIRSWSNYQKLCKILEVDFCVSDDVSFSNHNIAGYNVALSSPRLVLGTNTSPKAGASSMYLAVTKQIKETAMFISDSRVLQLQNQSSHILIQLIDGSALKASRVILACGVVGTAGILDRSISRVLHVEFSDHLPFMIYGIGRLLHKVPSGNDSMNVLSISMQDNWQTTLFASAYRLSGAPLSLLTSSLGLGLWGRGLKLFNLANMIAPIQVWSNSSIAKVRYSPSARIIYQGNEIHQYDRKEIQVLRSFLRGRGLYSFTRRGKLAQGFHYHNLQIFSNSQSYCGVDAFLREAFDNKVTCVDSSVLSEIGPRPHTLTSMAEAYARCLTTP